MNEADAKFMLLAIELASANVQSGKGGPFGAVVVRDGEIVATGVNEVTSRNDPTAHAEVMAIRHACEKLGSFQLTGCDVYTSCEPCPMCLAALYWSRCQSIYFGNGAADAARFGFDDGSIYDEIALPYRRRRIPMQRILADEAIASFELWLARADKVPY